MLVVLSGDCLQEALTDDKDEVLKTLIAICDQMVLTVKMRAHHQRSLRPAPQAFRRLIPFIVELEENFVPPKVVKPRRRTAVGNVPGLRSQHDVIFKEALAINADYLVTNRPDWLDLAHGLPSAHHLKVVPPTQYIAERTPKP